jgi:TM2 domain-containing membrane protein YozV
MITATINQGGVNLNSATQTQLSIYNASSGSAVAFSPNYTNIGRMDVDFAGMGITTTAVVGTGITKIAVMFNYLIAQGTGLNPLDTSITVSILEL